MVVSRFRVDRFAVPCCYPDGGRLPAFAPPQKLMVNLYPKEGLSVALFCAIL